MSERPAQSMFCKSCLYDLTGAPAKPSAAASSVCPECARPFDPSRPETFDPSRGRTRTRRRLRRALIAAAVIALLAIFAPRGWIDGSVTLRCSCGESKTFGIVQLVGPQWLGVAYPHFATSEKSSGGVGHEHRWSWWLQTDEHTLTWRGVKPGTALGATGISGAVNGVAVTPETAAHALAIVTDGMAKGGAGIRISTQGKASFRAPPMLSNPQPSGPENSSKP